MKKLEIGCKTAIMLALLGAFAYLKATTTPAVTMLYFVALLPLETVVLFWRSTK